MKKFTGDAQQAVMGNVKQGSQLSNEVHLHVVGGGTEQPVKIERRKNTKKIVSSYQKRQLYVLSLEWGEITGTPSVNAYGIIFDRFNISRVEELLSEHFPIAKEMMESQVNIAKAKAKAAKQAELKQREILAATPPPVTPVIAQPVLPVPSPVVKVPCQSCLQKSKDIASQNLTINVQWVFLGIMIIVCGYLLFKSFTTKTPPTMLESSCFNNGKAFSFGSTTTLLNKGLHECVIYGDMMGWKAIQRTKNK